ncbi:hypothetical protein C8F01DRAFT_994942 [Mycena amicta]|nr:hypothetical protein C8F01DRAFT_994942 [Mycena amicta]
MPDFKALSDHPLLRHLALNKVVMIMNLLGTVKNDITVAQPHYINTTHRAPLILPPTIVTFVVESTEIPAATILAAWDILKDEIWQLPEPTLSSDEKLKFRQYGAKVGLTWLTLFPPSQSCINMTCVSHGKPIKGHEARQVIIYTVANGAVPAWTIHISCPDCHTNFHHNYAVQDGMRTYYEKISNYIQIGEHQFAEYKLITLWITLHLTSWVSATNCALSFEILLASLANSFAGNIQVVVADGLSMGHPCCGEKHCMLELASNRDRFCPTHKHLDKTCSIVDCDEPIMPSKKTCSDISRLLGRRNITREIIKFPECAMGL